MNAGFGSWLLGMSLGASIGRDAIGMASGIFGVLADFWPGAALSNKRFRLCRPRGTAFSVVSRPAAGNSARHHHLDGAIGRCASGAAAGDRAVAAAALGARQSRRAAARPCRLPLCRSAPGAGGCRGDHLWLRHTYGGLAPPFGSTRPAHLAVAGAYTLGAAALAFATA